MIFHPFFQTVLKDGISKALRIKGEVEVTNEKREKVGLTLSDAPSTAEDGDQFVAIDEGKIYIYYSGSWREFE